MTLKKSIFCAFKSIRCVLVCSNIFYLHYPYAVDIFFPNGDIRRSPFSDVAMVQPFAELSIIGPIASHRTG